MAISHSGGTANCDAIIRSDAIVTVGGLGEVVGNTVYGGVADDHGRDDVGDNDIKYGGK
jgi:hypothetical protein